MTRAFPILVLLMWIAASGCDTRTAHDTPSVNADRGTEPEAGWGEEFVTRVYRAEGPDVIHADGSFEVRIFDGLGCPNFYVRDQVTWQDDTATVAVIAVRPSKPVACPQNAPPDTGRLLMLMPPSYDRVQVVLNAGTQYEIRLVVDLTNRQPD